MKLTLKEPAHLRTAQGNDQKHADSSSSLQLSNDFCSKKKFSFFILEREKGREKERERNIYERNIDRLPRPMSWDRTCNPGLCHNQESTSNLSGLRNNTQATEPHQPEKGMTLYF